MESPTCMEKLKQLYILLSEVSTATKLTAIGRFPNPSRERRAAQTLLKTLLGRNPTPIEINAVLDDCWREPGHSCCRDK